MFAMVFNCFLQIFQMHVLSVLLSFLYVASVVFGCFKSRLSVVHGMCVGSGRGTSGPRTGDVRAGAGGAGTVKRRPGSADPRMDTQNGVEKPTAAAGHPDVRMLAMPLIFCC
jgi:hypothetical protein